MDPLVAGVSGFLGGRAGSFLDALLEPLAKDIGEDLRNAYRRMSGRNVEAVLTDASTMLDAAGHPAQPVPGRILFPLLQYAALDEDSNMRRRWAALLANAAGSGPSNRILPGFLEVLKQLTPVQAQILEWMAQQEHARAWPDVPNYRDIPRSELEERFRLKPIDYAVLVSDLDRLQCVRGHNKQIQAAWEPKVQYDVIMLTPFGLAFIDSCRPPS